MIIEDIQIKNYVILGNLICLMKYGTLQDAIDFNRYAIKTRIDTVRFELLYKTVGGLIGVW